VGTSSARYMGGGVGVGFAAEKRGGSPWIEHIVGIGGRSGGETDGTVKKSPVWVEFKWRRMSSGPIG